MNDLFLFASANDLKLNSSNSKLIEFRKIDKEIEQWQETKTYKELFHSLEFALLKTRAKQLLKQLDIL